MRSIIILFLGLLIAALIWHAPLSDNLDFFVYDFIILQTEISSSDDNVVVVGIDDKTLDKYKDPIILWHKYLSVIINGLSAGGARAIVMDIVPAISLSRIAPEQDRQLIKAIINARKRGTPVYIGFNAGDTGMMPHRKFQFASSGLGFLNLYPDTDGIIRKQRLLLTGSNDSEAYSISLLAAGNGMAQSFNDLLQDLYIDYRLVMPSVISFNQVHDLALEGTVQELKEYFKGKIVFIGVTSPKLPDIYKTPVKSSYEVSNMMPSVLIQAYSTKTLLSGNWLRNIPSGLVWTIFFTVCQISGSLFLAFSPLRALAILLFSLLISAVGIYKAFTLFWVIPASPIAIGLVVPGAVTGIYRYVVEYLQFRRLQRFFSSYVNRQVMQEIIDSPDKVSFEGKRVVATVMFTDIRNFTALSEKMDPSVLLKGMNSYFSEMTKAVTEVNGYLNRYLGDGILAIFGAPNNLQNDGALNAVMCAFKMLKRLEELNKSGIFPGVLDEVEIGIGIHTGEAVVGNIGCYEKMDYSIIGDTVNLASRIEGLTKEYGVSVLVSESTYERVMDKVESRFVNTVKVKGRAQEVKLHEIVSPKEKKI